MKTINETQDDDLVFNEQTDSQIYVSDLKREWNSLNEDERSGWITLKERTIKLSAESVLDWIYEYMEQDGYEDMFVNLWNDTSEDFKQRMQGLLDEISNFPSAKVYDIDESINPFVDLEEDSKLFQYTQSLDVWNACTQRCISTKTKSNTKMTNLATRTKLGWDFKSID